MNLPNKITVTRFILAPLFLGAMLYYDRTGEYVYYLVSLSIFILSSISDGLDGYIARTRGMQTSLGKVLDPLADKFFLNSAIIILSLGIRDLYKIPVWFVVLVVSRDILIVGGGMIIRWFKGDLKVKPSWFGKTAAVLQMAAVIWILLNPYHPPRSFTQILIYATAFFTVFSGINYLRFGIRQIERDKEVKI